MLETSIYCKNNTNSIHTFARLLIHPSVQPFHPIAYYTSSPKNLSIYLSIVFSGTILYCHRIVDIVQEYIVLLFVCPRKTFEFKSHTFFTWTIFPRFLLIFTTYDSVDTLCRRICGLGTPRKT